MFITLQTGTLTAGGGRGGCLPSLHRPATAIQDYDDGYDEESSTTADREWARSGGTHALACSLSAEGGTSELTQVRVGPDRVRTDLARPNPAHHNIHVHRCGVVPLAGAAIAVDELLLRVRLTVRRVDALPCGEGVPLCRSLTEQGPSRTEQDPSRTPSVRVGPGWVRLGPCPLCAAVLFCAVRPMLRAPAAPVRDSREMCGCVSWHAHRRRPLRLRIHRRLPIAVVAVWTLIDILVTALFQPLHVPTLRRRRGDPFAPRGGSGASSPIYIAALDLDVRHEDDSAKRRLAPTPFAGARACGRAGARKASAGDTGSGVR
eukprot:gene6932-biopygen4115